MASGVLGDGQVGVQVKGLEKTVKLEINQDAVLDGAEHRHDHGASAVEQHAGVNNHQEIQKGEERGKAPGHEDDQGDGDGVHPDLDVGEEQGPPYPVKENGIEKRQEKDGRNEAVEKDEGPGEGRGYPAQVENRRRAQQERGKEHPEKHQPFELFPQLAVGLRGDTIHWQTVRRLAGTENYSDTAPAMVKIGRYMATTRVPMTTPRKTIIMGSIISVRLFTASSTSSS